MPPFLSRLSKISPRSACFVFAQVAPAAFLTQLHWWPCGYMLWLSVEPTRGTVSNNYPHNKKASSCFLFSTSLLIPSLYEQLQLRLMKWHQLVKKKFQWQLSAPSSVCSGEEDGLLMGPTPRLSLLYSIWTCASRRDDSCAAVMCRSAQGGISTSLRGHSHCHGIRRRAMFRQKGTIFEHMLLVMKAGRWNDLMVPARRSDLTASGGDSASRAGIIFSCSELTLRPLSNPWMKAIARGRAVAPCSRVTQAASVLQVWQVKWNVRGWVNIAEFPAAAKCKIVSFRHVCFL